MKRELQNGCMTRRYKVKGSWTEGCHFWVDPGIGEVERVQNGLRLRFRESHFLRLFALVYLFLLSSVLDFIKLSKGADFGNQISWACAYICWKIFISLNQSDFLSRSCFNNMKWNAECFCRVLLYLLTLKKTKDHRFNNLDYTEFSHIDSGFCFFLITWTEQLCALQSKSSTGSRVNNDCRCYWHFPDRKTITHVFIWC